MGFVTNKIERLADRVAPFIGWWVTELKQVFHPLLVHLESGRTIAQIRLARDRTDIRVTSYGEGTERSLCIENSFFALTDDQADRLKAFLADAEVTICIPQDQVCILDLKNVGPQRPTQESIRYRLLQESPLELEHVAFAWRHRGMTESTDSKGSRTQVALCRTTALDQVSAAAETYGLTPSIVGHMPKGGTTIDFAFPVPQSRALAWSLNAHGNVILLVTALLMPLLAILCVGAFASIDLQMKRRELDAQHTRLQASEMLMRRHAGAIAIHDALRRAARDPSAVSALNDLGRLIPQNTWLTEIRQEGRSLHLTGMSADPTSAAKAVTASPLLGDIRLLSVSAPNPDKATSQFEMSIVLVDKQ